MGSEKSSSGASGRWPSTSSDAALLTQTLQDLKNPNDTIKLDVLQKLQKMPVNAARCQDVSAALERPAQEIWQTTTDATRDLVVEDDSPDIQVVSEQWLILVPCRDEREQVQMLERFRGQEMECNSLVT